MSGLFGAFVVELGLVTFRAARGGIKTPVDAPIHAPLPSLYTSVALVYGGLSLLPGAPLPAVVGWGLVVATLLNLWKPGSANAAAAANTSVGKALVPGGPTVSTTLA